VSTEHCSTLLRAKAAHCVASDTIRGQHSRAVAAFLCLLPVAAAAAQDPTCVMAKNILVTGGNAGIGLALCKVSPVECGLKPNTCSWTLKPKAESLNPKP